jgi:glycerol-3-phosphate dehydrogenase
MAGHPMEKIVIIGGGIGGAIAHDLALRGFSVVVLEKGELCCGSTGRHHGLLAQRRPLCVA